MSHDRVEGLRMALATLFFSVPGAPDHVRGINALRVQRRVYSSRASIMILRRLASATATSASRFSLAPTIRQLLERPPATDNATTVSGWIKSIRKQKNVSFAVITDGSSAKGIQAVLLKGKDDELLRKYVRAAFLYQDSVDM